MILDGAVKGERAGSRLRQNARGCPRVRALGRASSIGQAFGRVPKKTRAGCRRTVLYDVDFAELDSVPIDLPAAYPKPKGYGVIRLPCLALFVPLRWSS